VPEHISHRTCSFPSPLSVLWGTVYQFQDLSDMPTLAKYLQGVSTVEISVECEKGHALPAWHRPDLKNLQGTCEVSKPADLSLCSRSFLWTREGILLVFGGLLGPSKPVGPAPIVPLRRGASLAIFAWGPAIGRAPLPLTKSLPR